MQNIFKVISISILILSASNSNAQARIVMNNGVFIVIDNAAKILLENPLSSAITTIGSTNRILSENENDEVIWKIGSSTGEYTIPWGKQSGVSVAAKINISTAGSADGRLELSTYGTSNTNTPYPLTVTNLMVVNVTAMDGSLSVVDRYWMIDANSYSNKPSVDLTFKYDNSELFGTNFIDEGQLKMQRWTGSTWGNVAFGTTNLVAQTTTATITPNDFYSIWILESSLIPLNVSYSEIIIENQNCQADFIVKNYIPDGLDKLKISKSIDGLNWIDVGYFSNCSEERCVFTDANPLEGLSYYKFENEDENGVLEMFETQSFYNNCEEELKIFPNPSNDFVNIVYPQSCDIELFDAFGKKIESFKTTPGIFKFNIDFLESGEYLLFISDNEDFTTVKKLVKF
jgi:hypothetical protein